MKIFNKKLFLILIIVILGIGISVFYWIFYKPSQNTNPSPVATTTPNNQTSNTPEIKIYRNTEFRFEFQYPENWKFEENTIYSPFSKFNLIGSPTKGLYISDPIVINIVTPDFVERQFADLKDSAIETNVAGITGEKYEYPFEGTTVIDIILPFGKYKMILGAKKPYEDIFNQILDTFKFLSSTTASIISQNILSSTIDTFQMGYIKKIFHQADNLFITIHAIQFIFDDNAMDGYSITDLHEERSFQVTSDAKINLISDALYELILNGVIQNNNLENPPPFKTILFTDLISSFETKNYSWDDTAMLRAPYHFLFTNGMISNIDQQYVP